MLAEHTTTVPISAKGVLTRFAKSTVENTTFAADAATDSPNVPVSVFHFHTSPCCCNTHEHLVPYLSLLPSSLLPLSLPYIVACAFVCGSMYVF